MVMRQGAYLLSIMILAFSLLSTNARAQEKTDRFNQWNFRISPYFWFVGFKGTIYRPPAPPVPSQLTEPRPPYEIDVSFRDISSNIKFAFMGAGEFRVKRFVTQFNLASIVLEGEAITPLDLVFQDVTYRFAYLSGDLGAGYFFIKNDKIELAALLGLKYIYFDIGGHVSLVGKVPLDGSRSAFWTDPILGFRTKYMPHPRVEIVAYGDTDGNVAGDDFNYQFIGVASYVVSPWFLVSVGYRLWGLEVKQSEALYNGQVSGALVRLGFQF